MLCIDEAIDKRYILFFPDTIIYSPFPEVSGAAYILVHPG